MEPTFEVEVDLAKAQRVGIKPGDVRRAAATLLSGLDVGCLFEEQKVFDVVVWGTPETRASLTNIRDLLIDTPTGEHVGLGDVADVRVTSVPQVIRHEDVSRCVDVGADVSGRDVGAVASDIKDTVRAAKFPLEYHAEVLGDYAVPAGGADAVPRPLRWPPRSGSSCSCRRHSGAGGWRPCCSWPCRRRSSAACWRRSSPAAASRSARLSGSSRCSRSRPAMSSC